MKKEPVKFSANIFLTQSILLFRQNFQINGWNFEKILYIAQNPKKEKVV